MWSQTYRHHFIMAFPSFDTATRKWRAQADISWCHGNGRESAFVRYRHHAKTETEAVHFALQRSIEWVDRNSRYTSGNCRAYDQADCGLIAHHFWRVSYFLVAVRTENTSSLLGSR